MGFGRSNSNLLCFLCHLYDFVGSHRLFRGMKPSHEIYARLLPFFAPHSLSGWVFRSLLFLTLIFLVDLLHEVLLYGKLRDPLVEYIPSAVLVGGPFMLMGLALISHLDRLHKRLEYVSSTDMLTKLPNRRAFMKGATEMLNQSGGSLVMLDVDHFKRVNDTYGHQAGDECLAIVAKHIGEAVEDNESCGRLGGEEFAILLADENLVVAESRMKCLVGPFQICLKEQEIAFEVTLSIGMVAATRGSDLATALAGADEALYKSKSAGRARLTVLRPMPNPISEDHSSTAA